MKRCGGLGAAAGNAEAMAVVNPGANLRIDHRKVILFSVDKVGNIAGKAHVWVAPGITSLRVGESGHHRGSRHWWWLFFVIAGGFGAVFLELCFSLARLL